MLYPSNQSLRWTHTTVKRLQVVFNWHLLGLRFLSVTFYHLLAILIHDLSSLLFECHDGGLLLPF